MAEPVLSWWSRRQFSKGREVPYPVGTYREAWAGYPMLVRQYHPELNAGITLSQIPPAADVLLLWQCETGHLFVATPTEQRDRPGPKRRRSAWCPECADAASPPRISLPATDTAASATAPRAAAERSRPRRAAKGLCPKTPDLRVGEPFASGCAPAPASAVEGTLRAELFGRLAVTAGMNAVRVGRPFFTHLEVWPDIVLPELRVAIEYDSPGRFGLEHVGKREDSDRRKDRALRSAHWEVIRIRTAGLERIGPHDIQVKALNRRTPALVLDALRELRGSLLVDAYLR